jgi:1,4-alpha-glucan branching enzyme
MKQLLSVFLFFSVHYFVFSQVQNITYTVSPNPFTEDDLITITVSNLDPSIWGVTDVYLWAWSHDLNGLNPMDAPNNGSWTNSNEAHKLTNNNNGTFSISFVPSVFFARTNIGSFGFLVKAKDGTGDKKTQDIIVQIGSITTPNVVEQALPTGMQDGINFDPNDPTKVTLVLYAPNKTFINVIGDFNSWQRDDINYLLKRDSTNDRFWIELTGLTPQHNHMYQYLVDGIIRVADPYSTVVLDEYNDSYIDASTYPNLPQYPTNSTVHAVTLLRTGETEFNWQHDAFQRPDKTDLVVYELLIRDFDDSHSYQGILNHLDYLEDLGINAIELMPIQEFDGNESWGYNPAFHMAIDKYYGTKDAFKQFVDECHSRNIAVIVDVVYNHATGQNPYYRMWNTVNGGYGGEASADNPFFNPVATHAYNVFNDFNHSSQATKDYVKKTTQYWIDEYHIDGFRWDLTKGFTQNCTASDEGCTGSYQADRVAILKEYADYQWQINSNFYVIFEHLGTNQEETEWVNYRINEGKGILVWGNHNFNYNEATMGYHDMVNGQVKSDFSWISYLNRGWSVPGNISYMESHDEERLMYKNLQYGNSSGSYDITNLTTALDRMELAGTFFFTIPGPKMIWQFGELGYDYSIMFNGRTGNKPIRWDYFDEQDRRDLYNLWSKLIQLKKQESIFKTSNFTLDVGNTNGLKSIHLTNDDTNDPLQYITIIGNFDVTAQSINPQFQQTGTWYNLLDNNSIISVNNGTDLISLQPGEFKVFGNSQVNLDVNSIKNDSSIVIYPSVIENSFKINIEVEEVEIFNVYGSKIKTFNNKSQNTNGEFIISDLESSIYIVRIKNNGKYISKKILKL